MIYSLRKFPLFRGPFALGSDYDCGVKSLTPLPGSASRSYSSFRGQSAFALCNTRAVKSLTFRVENRA